MADDRRPIAQSKHEVRCVRIKRYDRGRVVARSMTLDDYGEFQSAFDALANLNDALADASKAAVESGDEALLPQPGPLLTRIKQKISDLAAIMARVEVAG